MKFKIKQEKFQELLEKLTLSDIFPSSVFSTMTSNGQPIAFSIQREEHGQALRCLKLTKEFFEEIDAGAIESIEIDVSRALSIVKRMRPNTILSVETVGNKLKIYSLEEDKDSNGNVTDDVEHIPHITFKKPDEEVDIQLPFELKDGVPLVGEKKIPLNVCFDVKLIRLKAMTEYGSSVKTNYYRFTLNNDKLEVRVGDLHDFSDFVLYRPRVAKVKNGNNFSVILTFAIAEIAKTFRKDFITFNGTKDAPVWIYEKGDDYTLGVLLPPYIPVEEEGGI
jgi:hypothetical protein